MNQSTRSAAASEVVLAYSAKQLAEKLGLSERSIRRMDTTGELPAPVRLRTRVKWRASEIEDWLAAGAPGREAWEKMREGVRHGQ